MKEDNINHILDLGVEIMTRKGYHGLGLKELLDEAGIPKGSFYYYFDSKEDFGRKVITHYAERSQKYMIDMLTDKRRSPRRRLENLFKDREKAYKSSGFKEGCLLGNCSTELAGQYESMQLVLANKFSDWKEVMSACIKEGQELGEFKAELPVDNLADFVINSWEGALVRMQATRSIEPFTLFADYVMNVVLKA